MSAAGTPGADPWVIPARERVRYEEQFRQLKPINGIVTGDQAKGFLLQSQLPPMILGQIWALADTDADGKMDIHEFLIACKLINLKLRGFEIPKVLPPTLIASVKQQSQPPQSLVAAPPRPEPPKTSPPAPIMTQPVANNFIPTGIVPPMQNNMMGMPPIAPVQQVQPMQPLQMTQIPMSAVPPMVAPQIQAMIPSLASQQPTSAIPIVPLAPVALPSSGTTPVNAVQAVSGVPSMNTTPRASISSLDRNMMDSLIEWAVPQATKLKYTQIFNTTDRTRTGFLTGVQARNVMMQTNLPQNILAQVWAISDMDSDGRLGCEEFVLAMHLCEQAALGNKPPKTLPPDLIPPSFRRPARTASRTASVSSQGSAQPDVDLSLISQNSFEDKRKENFEKGQAELERRRKALLDQQRKEADERERKEREEFEKREKARLEAERKRAEELELQMREQQERERQLEEERKRQAEQREAARKEMERQRQLEWEKQRLQELQQQRQREQEAVLRLKAKNQSLTIELSTLNDSVKELSQKICDTRVGVSNVKATIDGMRSTRDTSMQEMSQLKNKLKEQNAKLLQLSQEKIRMDARNKMNTQMNDKHVEQTKLAFENKEITIKNLKEKIEDMQLEIDAKMSDIENNNSQLTELKGQLTKLVAECEDLYVVYEEKKNTVLEMKGATKASDYSTAWGNDDEWGSSAADNQWPAQDKWESVEENAAPPSDSVKYRAIYEFSARSQDEISFQPGDIIYVPLEQNGQPGWLAGEIRGHTGWFPESYVELADGTTDVSTAAFAPAEIESKPLEEIAEVPEGTTEPEPTWEVASVEEGEYYISSYPYQSAEAGDLTFNVGEFVLVVKKDGDWWTGKIGERVGIFPSNYVQKTDNAANATNAETQASTNLAAAREEVVHQQELEQDDNEVSQINEAKEPLKADFAALAQQAQTIKSGKKPEIASVIAPYQASSNEQLSLERGQLIMIRKKTDSGWWEGELQAKGRKRQVGWFPASYVKVLNSSGRVSGRTTPVSNTRMQQEIIIDKVVALYPYTAGNPDELNFLKDDIISVTAREEQAWWRGELNGVSGLFPSNYVQPLQSLENNYDNQTQIDLSVIEQSFPSHRSILNGNEDSLDEDFRVVKPNTNKKRKQCINELMRTEKQYIGDLIIIKRVFESPLKESSLVNHKEIQNIFVNLDDIMECNQNFLDDLMDQDEFEEDVIGEVLCKHLPKMVPYVHFCKKQLESGIFLQNMYESSAQFREILLKCQSDPALRGMTLSSFLLKPMQRITKYPLLIEKILLNTPDNHPDRKRLGEAKAIADKFLQQINEHMKIKDDNDRLNWLQENVAQNDVYIKFNGNTNKLGPRSMLHFGHLTKVKSGKELLGFLCNDFILLVQASKSLNTHFTFQRNANINYKIYKQPLMIQNIKVIKAPPESIENVQHPDKVFHILQDGTSPLILLTTSTNECNLWLKRVEIAKELNEKALALIPNKSRPKATGVQHRGRLIVQVLRGSRFIHTAIKIHSSNWLTIRVISGNDIISTLMPSLNTNTIKRKTLKGKSFVQNVYCKIQVGDVILNTSIAMDERNGNGNFHNGIPHPPTLVWNDCMQFPIISVTNDHVTLTVFEMSPFNPDEFLGRVELKLSDLHNEWLARKSKEPILKKLILHHVDSGEVVIKYDMQFFNSY